MLSYVINDLGHSIDMNTNVKLGMRTPDFVTAVFNEMLEEDQLVILGKIHSVNVALLDSNASSVDLLVSYLTDTICYDITVDFVDEDEFGITDVYQYV